MVRVHAFEIQFDADLLELISEPIIDLAVSFVQKDTELPAAPTEAAEITVNADERDDSVVFVVSGTRCRAESQHSAVNTVLKHLDALMLEHFGAGGLTLDGKDVASCWLRFPKFPTDAPVREFRTADFTFLVPHSLILDVAGPDVVWPGLPYHHDGRCPRVRLQLDATGKYLEAASVAEEPANGPIAMILGYGLKRLSLDVDEVGEKRHVQCVKSDVSKGESGPVPFVWKALLDDGELVPFISPARLAQHLNLE